MHVSEKLLSKLADLSSNDRTILSVYIDLSSGWDSAEEQIASEFDRLLPFLTEQEKEYIEVSREFMEEYFNLKKSSGYRGPGLAFFADLGSDYAGGIELTIPPTPLVAADDEAILLPLALELDEYEPIGVIMADASCARVLLVAGQVTEDANKICTKIHHQSKVGGWSQMRYQRRRDKEILHFAKQIAKDASKIFEKESIRRVIFAGKNRVTKAISDELPKKYKDYLIDDIPWDFNKQDNQLFEKIQPIIKQTESDEEKEILSRLVSEVRKSGLASVGVDQTRRSLQIGQVETLILDKFSMDSELAEELVSLAEAIDAHVEFVPAKNDILKPYNGVGALLRYKI